MATQRVRIEGAARLERTLKAAGADLDDLKALHADVGSLLAAGAEPLAAHLTGALAASIRSSGTAKAAVVRAGGGRVPYAGVQEFGWPARNIPAHPALTASLERHEPEVMALYERQVDHTLAEVKGV